MKTKRMLLLTAGLSGIVLTAAPAQAGDLLPAAVGNLTGAMAISQHIPCNNTVSVTTPVLDGKLALSPSEGIDVTGGKQFMLTQGTVSFQPFTATGSCLGFGDTKNYTEVEAQLDKAVSFVATPTGTPGLYDVKIPKGDVEFWEATIVNGASANSYQQPSQDVTGTIDLVNGTVTLHIVMATSIHFQEGCVPPCVIDETDSGTLTTDINGTIAFPDTDGDGVPDRTDNCRFVPNPTQAPVPTPDITAPPNLTIGSCTDHQIGLAVATDVCEGGPVTIADNAPTLFVAGPNTVTWTATDTKSRTATANQIVTVVEANPPAVSCTAVGPPGNSFQVSAADTNGCAALPTIRLGSFVLANDEIIKIEQTGQPGVRLINALGANHVRHFLVGKGEAVISATDGSSNVSTAVCQ